MNVYSTRVKHGKVHMLVNTQHGVMAACGARAWKDGTTNPKKVTCKSCCFAVDIVHDARWGGRPANLKTKMK